MLYRYKRLQININLACHCEIINTVLVALIGKSGFICFQGSYYIYVILLNVFPLPAIFNPSSIFFLSSYLISVILLSFIIMTREKEVAT